MDNVSPQRRSEIMSRIRSQGTKPEMSVRRLIYAMGFRYRLHARELPGKPDLVFRSRRKIIFVHGCFWHRHDCNLARLPKSRLQFWVEKLEKNRERDARVQEELAAAGWRFLVIWECELANSAAVESKVRGFLDAQC